MFGIFDSIAEWFRGLLIEGITSNFTGMFNEVNNKVGEIAGQVGATPQGWNADIFNLIRTLSETVVIPVAGMILTFILCYELIHMVIEKNNMAEFDVFNIYKWIFKTFCAVYILTHTFDIVMGVFALAQNVVNGSASVITGSLNMTLAMNNLHQSLQTMGIWELIGLWLEMTIVSLGIWVISICIFIIVFGRMLEVYLVISIAPIPLSTVANHQWSHIDSNYLKSLFAIAFQGFLIMVCVAIYAVLIQNIPAADNIHMAVFGTLAYAVLLVFALFKTSSLSRTVFSAH